MSHSVVSGILSVNGPGFTKPCSSGTGGHGPEVDGTHCCVELFAGGVRRNRDGQYMPRPDAQQRLTKINVMARDPIRRHSSFPKAWRRLYVDFVEVAPRSTAKAMACRLRRSQVLATTLRR